MAALRRKVIVLAAVLAAAAALAACKPAGPTSPFLEAGEHGAAVRRAFNDDAGKVRVLMLVAPT